MIRGRFSDGERARSFAVSIELEACGLRLKDQTGIIDLEWSYGDIIAIPAPLDGGMVVFNHRERPQTRLQMTEQAAAIIERLPRTALPRAQVSLSIRSLVMWAALAIAIVVGANQALPHLAAALAPQIPENWSNRLGDFAIDQLLGEDRAKCTGPEGLAALAKLIAPLEIAADGDGPLRVQVIEDDEVNAFAVPARSSVVFSGLLGFVDSQDELSGILAHEMGHVAYQHSLEGFMRALSSSLLIELMFGFAVGDVSIIHLADQMASMDYSRDMEREADLYAVDLLSTTGIGTAGLVAFFKRMGSVHEDDADLAFLSTHPSVDERIGYLSGWVAEPQGGNELTAAEWQALKQICSLRSSSPG